MLTSWLVEGLSYRHSIVPDGISYLDIAERLMRGNWQALINAYWSPGYPLLLACWLSIFKPSRYWELTFVQCFNCLALAVALFCFEYLLNSLFQYQKQLAAANPELEPLPAWALRATGYALFFWISVSMIPASLDTPDALVFASILLGAGIIARIAAGRSSWLNFAALGAILGLGYLIKAVMFPMTFVFLGTVLWIVRKTRNVLPHFLLTAIIFSLVSGPFVLAISKTKGRLTVGDSARINYAEYVDDVALAVNWQGGPPGSGTPIHPTRKLFDSPPLYEYATPVIGTYPPWSDPSYWYDGVHPHFQLGGQLNALRHGLDAYFDLFTQLGALSAGFLMLLFCQHHWHDFARVFVREAFLWVPGLVGMGMYSLILVEPRYIAGFVILLWAAGFFALRAPTEPDPKVVWPATLAILLVLGAQIAWSVGHSIVRFASFRSVPEWEVAMELRELNIDPGDRVAFVGFALPDHYWAYLAGASIVAEVPVQGVSSFWAASPEIRNKVIKLFAQANAKAVVAEDVPPQLFREGLKRVGDSKYFIFDLSTSQTQETTENSHATGSINP